MHTPAAANAPTKAVTLLNLVGTPGGGEKGSAGVEGSFASRFERSRAQDAPSRRDTKADPAPRRAESAREPRLSSTKEPTTPGAVAPRGGGEEDRAPAGRAAADAGEATDAAPAAGAGSSADDADDAGVVEGRAGAPASGTGGTGSASKPGGVTEPSAAVEKAPAVPATTAAGHATTSEPRAAMVPTAPTDPLRLIVPAGESLPAEAEAADTNAPDRTTQPVEPKAARVKGPSVKTSASSPRTGVGVEPSPGAGSAGARPAVAPAPPASGAAVAGGVSDAPVGEALGRDAQAGGDGGQPKNERDGAHPSAGRGGEGVPSQGSSHGPAHGSLKAPGAIEGMNSGTGSHTLGLKDGEFAPALSARSTSLTSDRAGVLRVSAGPTHGSSAAGGVNQDRIDDQVAKGLAAAFRHKGGTLTLRLSPEALGPLRIDVRLEGGLVTARFEPTTVRAFEALAGGLEGLSKSMQGRGLSVDRIEVVPPAASVLGSQESGSSREREEGWGQPRDRGREEAGGHGAQDRREDGSRPRDGAHGVRPRDGRPGLSVAGGGSRDDGEGALSGSARGLLMLTVDAVA
ncbi:MAG: flagellar hook-length control protein FliK [Phycisphaeraceae bacterium]|nr:MAG: flagellar hook-length control protein FliK [Phycisphaeraceae bacterium]